MQKPCEGCLKCALVLTGNLRKADLETSAPIPKLGTILSAFLPILKV